MAAQHCFFGVEYCLVAALLNEIVHRMHCCAGLLPAKGHMGDATCTSSPCLQQATANLQKHTAAVKGACPSQVACELEMWGEAFRSVEDIQGLIALSKKAPKAQMMANYYAKLTKIFAVSEKHLYNGYAWCVRCASLGQEQAVPSCTLQAVRKARQWVAAKPHPMQASPYRPGSIHGVGLRTDHLSYNPITRTHAPHSQG